MILVIRILFIIPVYSPEDSDSDYDDEDTIPLKDLADHNESDSGDKFSNETMTSSNTSESDNSVQLPNKRHKKRRNSSSSDENEDTNTDSESAEGISDIEIGTKAESLRSKPVAICDANENKKSSHIDDDTSSNDDKLQCSSENDSDANDPEYQK